MTLTDSLSIFWFTRLDCQQSKLFRGTRYACQEKSAHVLKGFCVVLCNGKEVCVCVLGGGGSQWHLAVKA